MSTQAEQRNTQRNQNTGMYPTNNQVGGPGALGSVPAQNGDQNSFNNSNTNDPSHQQTQQQRQPPPPVHPDRAGQDGQHGQDHVQDASAFGAGHHPAGQSSVQNDTGGPAETGATYDSGDVSYGGKRDVQYGEGRGVSSSTNVQHANQHQPPQHTLDRRGHRAPDAKAAHAGEAGAAYEGGKLAHGGQHLAGDTGATGQAQPGAASGPGQHGDFGANHHHHGVGDGDFDSGGHTGARAAEGAATYEAGKLTHGHGQGVGGQHGLRGHTEGHPIGSGAYDANPNIPTGTRPTTGQFDAGTGETGISTGAHNANPNVPAGTHPTGTGGVGGGPGAVPPHGATGRVHPTSGTYDGQQARYTGQPTTGPGTATGATAGTGASGTGSGFSGVGKATGQAHVILGKLQQAGGAILSDDAMKAKGLEREAKGVAPVDQQEAQRLEGMADARREKAGGVHAHGGPQTAASAGVDPTVGTHGRNM